jgi:hypothetical protein
MPPIYHVGATAICPHAGQVTVLSTMPRVQLNGMPAATMADVYIVAGCAFNVSGAPHPCVEVKWLMPALRVTVMGQPVILQTSMGLAKAADQAPQGPASILVVQPRVQAL